MSLFAELVADKDGKNVNKDRSEKDKSGLKKLKKYASVYHPLGGIIKHATLFSS